MPDLKHFNSVLFVKFGINTMYIAHSTDFKDSQKLLYNRKERKQKLVDFNVKVTRA